MIKQYLLSPGPTPIPNEVALAMSETMIHHRTPQFNKVFEEARQGLKALFGTKGDVLMLASSGTGAMEAAVCSLWHYPWAYARRTLSGTVCPWSPDFPLRSTFRH